MTGIDWVLCGLMLAVGAGGVLVGAASGFYSASRDLQRERSRAWRLGLKEGRAYERDLMTAVVGEVIAIPGDPYSKTPINPEPRIVMTPTPPRSVLFDQDADETTEADQVYRAPQVVTDDGEVLSSGSGQPGAGTLVIPRALLEDGRFKFVKFERGDD